MIYHYTIAYSANLDYIHEQVSLSTMTNKDIDFCRWDEEECDLEVHWLSEISENDKLILDQIVSES